MDGENVDIKFYGWLCTDHMEDAGVVLVELNGWRPDKEDVWNEG